MAMGCNLPTLTGIDHWIAVVIVVVRDSDQILLGIEHTNMYVSCKARDPFTQKCINALYIALSLFNL